jgi:DNA-binding transcriptional MerR regulator
MIKMDSGVQNELDYVLTHRESLNILKLSEEIKVRRFTIKDVGVAYRSISHWDSQGLLIGEYSEGKWRKYDLVEFVWLKMIIKLREFNVSIEKIKWIKTNLIQNVKVSELIGIEEVADAIMKLTSESNRPELIKLLNDRKFIDHLSTQSLNLFENIILEIITFQNSYSILIGTSEIIPIKHSALESLSELKEFNDLLRGSFIAISVSEILRDYMIKDIGIKKKNKLVLLTEQEEKVLEVLRQEDLKSVTIKYGEDKEIDLLETVKIVKLDKRARLIDFIMTHGYQDITIKTQNGEIVYCENKKKIRVQYQK